MKTFRICCYVLALPLIATAAASAHQWFNNGDDNQIGSQDTISALATSASNPTAEYLKARRTHSVSLDEQGNVHGRVASINPADGSAIGLAGLKVEFYRDGQLMRDGNTREDGTFTIGGLGLGPYSFFAHGNGGYVAHGVNVVKSDEPIVLETAAVSPILGRVNTIVQETQFAPNLRDSTRTSELQPMGANRVELTGGVLSGQIFSAHGEQTGVVNLTLFKDQVQVAEVVTTETGEFKVPDVKAGVYGFVAAGPTGFAVGSFEAIDGAATASVDNGEARVSLQDEASPNLQIVLVIPAPIIVIVQPEPQPIFDPAFIGNQTAFGPMAGPVNYVPTGGGGFGGGGIGIAGLTLGIIALADDDNPPVAGTPFGL